MGKRGKLANWGIGKMAKIEKLEKWEFEKFGKSRK